MRERASAGPAPGSRRGRFQAARPSPRPCGETRQAARATQSRSTSHRGAARGGEDGGRRAPDTPRQGGTGIRVTRKRTFTPNSLVQDGYQTSRVQPRRVPAPRRRVSPPSAASGGSERKSMLLKDEHWRSRIAIQVDKHQRTCVHGYGGPTGLPNVAVPQKSVSQEALKFTPASPTPPAADPR